MAKAQHIHEHLSNAASKYKPRCYHMELIMLLYNVSVYFHMQALYPLNVKDVLLIQRAKMYM